ncbi:MULTISPECIES: alcohol dehydrogenase [Bifidobacterium]|jgi:hypothetical protein|uniref:alcohol dehydrogenase n=1 Tax=Bifidobacterium TaxID=1678 RepID=UPI001F32D502|nr:alcohol dehydrogenase [Bifidobacterium tibiigranuli]MCH3974029.1 alcohol dehydrogenase [Bifidobacterium tibiigranuli]MCH4189059.1 alcohol dehydrogenase [Bifidobacterium tibiigranuli]MCH4204019.1 alcohol dehydrogenase [Bifidobacterium tibiigranuli]MCH4274474.1 alcohol dehydrogenase [Bifidobacterium tibiigranuli]MCI1212372.1 alcohol dehydrogenase [Bifidobacterium tibiigranuli]
MTQASTTNDRDAHNESVRFLPWSHQLDAPLRALICVVAGMGVAIVGTFAHRMGAAQNIPYGLVLALVIVGLSTWCARSRSGAIGLALHLIASSAVAWLMAMGYPHGDVVTPIGFGVPMPYFSEHVGYFWLFGMIVVQVALLMMPARLFIMPGRRADDDYDAADKNSKNSKDSVSAAAAPASGAGIGL